MNSARGGEVVQERDMKSTELLWENVISEIKETRIHIG